MAAVWTCPVCRERVPVEGITATPVAGVGVGRVSLMRVPPAALADAYAHVWTAHPDAVADAQEEREDDP